MATIGMAVILAVAFGIVLLSGTSSDKSATNQQQDELEARLEMLELETLLEKLERRRRRSRDPPQSRRSGFSFLPTLLFLFLIIMVILPYVSRGGG